MTGSSATPRISTVVLCGGPLNPANVPIGASASNAMVPVNGKPVIAWILDDLIRKSVDGVVVVLRQEHERLRMFLERAYQGRLAIRFAVVGAGGSIVDSLAKGLGYIETPDVRVVLGDTLIADGFDTAVDTIYAGEVEDSRRWCVLKLDAAGRITDYADKQELPGCRHVAAAGLYVLGDVELLKACARDTLEQGGRELSDVLARYGRSRPLTVTMTTAWHDFGHIDNFTRAKTSLLQPRFFNSLRVDPVLNTITKISSDHEKLHDELAWYRDLPDELKVLTPRIVSEHTRNGSAEIVQEYYGYPTLAELFVYSDLPAESWRSILRRVLAVQGEFRKHGETATVTRDDAIEMYLAKTRRRLDHLRDSDAAWANRLAADAVTYNGRSLRNAFVLLDDLAAREDVLIRGVVPSVVHGDLCFSNILFDFNNQILRLIDPRGRFGGQGIFGDARYDIAKLRHSAHGRYDLIMADMFQIAVNGHAADGRVFADASQDAVSGILDGLVRGAGFDLREIQIIEGLLFLSMLPLHRDNSRRQAMLYFTGLELLNEVL